MESNGGPLVKEATTLTTEPQAQAKFEVLFFDVFRFGSQSRRKSSEPQHAALHQSPISKRTVSQCKYL